MLFAAHANHDELRLLQGNLAGFLLSSPARQSLKVPGLSRLPRLQCRRTAALRSNRPITTPQGMPFVGLQALMACQKAPGHYSKHRQQQSGSAHHSLNLLGHPGPHCASQAVCSVFGHSKCVRRRPSTASQEETKSAAAGRSAGEDSPTLAIQGQRYGSRRPSAAQQPPKLAPPHPMGQAGPAAGEAATIGASPGRRPSSYAIDCATSLPNSPALKLPLPLKLPPTGDHHTLPGCCALQP